MKAKYFLFIIVILPNIIFTQDTIFHDLDYNMGIGGIEIIDARGSTVIGPSRLYETKDYIIYLGSLSNQRKYISVYSKSGKKYNFDSQHGGLTLDTVKSISNIIQGEDSYFYFSCITKSNVSGIFKFDITGKIQTNFGINGFKKVEKIVSVDVTNGPMKVIYFDTSSNKILVALPNRFLRLDTAGNNDVNYGNLGNGSVVIEPNKSLFKKEVNHINIYENDIIYCGLDNLNSIVFASYSVNGGSSNYDFVNVNYQTIIDGPVDNIYTTNKKLYYKKENEIRYQNSKINYIDKVNAILQSQGFSNFNLLSVGAIDNNLLLVSGHVRKGFTGLLVVIRMDKNGILDEKFDNDGILLIKSKGFYDYGGSQPENCFIFDTDDYRGVFSMVSDDGDIFYVLDGETLSEPIMLKYRIGKPINYEIAERDIAYFDFNESLNNSYNNNHLKAEEHNLITFSYGTDRFGKPKSCLNAGWNFSLPDEIFNDIGTSNFTISFWFKTKNNGNILKKGNTLCNSSLMQTKIEDGLLIFTLNESNIIDNPIDYKINNLIELKSDINVKDNNWHCAQIIVDRNNFCKLYVDGRLNDVTFKNISNFNFHNNEDYNVGHAIDILQTGIDFIDELKINAAVLNPIDCVTVSTDNIQIREPMHIYPNPASETLTVELEESFKGNVIYRYELLNIVGQVGKSGILPNSLNTLDISNIPKGMYLLRIQNQKNIFSKKVVIE